MKLALKLAAILILINSQIIAQETRTWVGNSSDWHDPANWLPFGVPGGQDDVIHENNGESIMLNGLPTTGVDTFLITGGGRLFTDGGILTVNDFNDSGLLRIVGNGSELIAEPSTTASTAVSSDAIELESGAVFKMQGSSVRIDRSFSLDATSRITGFGTIEILAHDPADPPIVMHVDGTIQAIGGAIAISTEQDALVDISTANLDAGFGNIFLDVALANFYNGTMTIGQDRAILSDQPFGFSSTATLNLFGGDNDDEPALFLSQDTTVNGQVNIDGLAVISGKTTIQGAAEINVPDFDDELRLTGTQSVVIGNSGNSSQSTPSFNGIGRIVNDSATGMLLINEPEFDATFVNRSNLGVTTLVLFLNLDIGEAHFNNFVQTESGTLHYDIAQDGSGTVFGESYVVNGTAEIAGNLKIRPVDFNSFGLPEFQVGDSFQIIHSDVAVFGTFDEIEYPEAPQGAFWQVRYEPQTVRIVLVDYLLGDINGDGELDLLDVQPFIAVLTNNIYVESADINQDGNVDLLDVDPFVNILIGG